MKLFKTAKGIFLKNNNRNYILKGEWNTIINRDNLFEYLSQQINDEQYSDDSKSSSIIEDFTLAPIGQQEVWAAGVTYLRSRDARMEESKDSGGADFYSKVYNAQRPELFFKSMPHRVAAHKENVFIRKDSQWNAPEPELTLFINSNGKIQGYTIGNDMSSRDIEGENPLYLPQAKVYEKSAALGPCLYVPEHPISSETVIGISVNRDEKNIFKSEIQLNRMKRSFTDLTEYLFRECDFENGVFLMTGTGIVPPNEFSLKAGDKIEISIDKIGMLTNIVAYK
ncbi:MAG: fumarylacetoacetate hydrolase family protein [Bacteroidota bacterium]|nr:fumarylacetoacetate hydrolase family protein [Bacteroidota bacterium]